MFDHRNTLGASIVPSTSTMETTVTCSQFGLLESFGDELLQKRRGTNKHVCFRQCYCTLVTPCIRTRLYKSIFVVHPFIPVKCKKKKNQIFRCFVNFSIWICILESNINTWQLISDGYCGGRGGCAYPPLCKKA